MSTTKTNAPYVHLNKDLAPTAAASLHNKQVVRAHDNLGQGSEQVDLIPELSAFFVGQEGKSNKSYNPVPGGPEDLRAAMAAWTQRMFGTQANADTLSVSQQQGRGLFNDFANYWGAQFNLTEEKWRNHYLNDPKKRRPAVLVPRNSWSLTHTIYKKAGFEVIEYDIENGDIPGSFEKAINRYKDDYVIAAAYFNFPHNASGLHLSDEDGQKICEVADKFNLTDEHSYQLALQFDTPYYSACPMAESEGAYLETGLRHVLDTSITDPKDVVTPKIIHFSGSKYMRTAREGLAWEISTPDLVKGLRAYHNMSGNGVRYDPVFFANLVRAFQPENDHLWGKQLDLDRTKFADNYADFKKVHGDDVLEGGANLVGLMRLRDVFGKVVMCHDGQERYIPELGNTEESNKAARQAYLSYVANGTPEHEGIILVDGEVDKENNPLARVAMAKPQEDFSKANTRLGEINEYIRNSRSVSPEEGQKYEVA